MSRDRFVIEQDLYDQDAFNGLYEQSEALKAYGRKEQGYRDLLEDIWASLYKVSPVLKEKVPSHLRFHKQVMEGVIQTTQYHTLRPKTRLDEVASAIATVSVARQLEDELGEEQLRKEMIKKQMHREITELQQAIDTIDQVLQHAANQGKPAPERLLDKKNRYKAAIDQLKQDLKSLGRAPSKQKVRIAVRRGLASAEQAIEEIEALGYGTGSGQMAKVNPEDRIKLAEKLIYNTKFREIARMAGRLKNIAMKKQKDKIKHGRDEIVDITTGNDLARVLPSELVYLKNPLTKRIFLRRFAERQLLQYEMQGQDTKAKGPIIVCIDCSGSMRGYREMWAKAVAFALMQIAVKQKRKFSTICFSSSSEIEKWVVNNPSEVTPDLIISIIETFFGGGTDFQTPLNEALSIMSDMPEADVIFITDGDCEVTDIWLNEFLKNKNNLRFKVYSIQVGFHSTTLEKFSDIVFLLQDDGEDVVLSEIFQI